MELDKLIAKEKELESKLIESGGEITEEENESRLELEKGIESEVIKYAWFLTNNSFKDTRERLRAHKKSIDAQLKKLDSIESIIKFKVANVLEERGPIPIEVQGIEKQIELGYTKSNTIMLEKVDKMVGRYVVVMEPQLWEYLVGNQRLASDIIDYEHKVILKDLPDDSKAISTQLNSKIKIVTRRK